MFLRSLQAQLTQWVACCWFACVGTTCPAPQDPAPPRQWPSPASVTTPVGTPAPAPAPAAGPQPQLPEDRDDSSTIITDGWVDHDDDPLLEGEFPAPTATLSTAQSAFASGAVVGDVAAAQEAAAGSGSGGSLGVVGGVVDLEGDLTPEAVDQAVKACVATNLEHIVGLLQTQTEHALSLQGLRYGCGNTKRNLRWMLVGWDNEPGTLL